MLGNVVLRSLLTLGGHYLHFIEHYLQSLHLQFWLCFAIMSTNILHIDDTPTLTQMQYRFYLLQLLF